MTDKEPCRGAFWAVIDPTGGDPFLGGPVALTVCSGCGTEKSAHRDRKPVRTWRGYRRLPRRWSDDRNGF